MKKLLLAVLVLLATAAHGQQLQVNCNPTTPCNPSTGPANTGTGDPAWKAFGKLNANNNLLNVFGLFGGNEPANYILASQDSSSGPLGLRAMTASDLPNTINATTTGGAATLTGGLAQCTGGQTPTGIAANGDATGCFTPGGGGSLSPSGSPAAHQVGIYQSGTTISGLTAPSTASVLTQSSAGSDPAWTATTAILTGTTSAIGGSSLAAGACSSGTVTLTGITSSMRVSATATADPQVDATHGVSIYAFMSATNTATVRVCALVATTPNSVTYNVQAY